MRGFLYKLFQSLPATRLKAALSARYKKRLRERNVVEIRHGLVMDLDPWEWIQNQLRREGIIEPHTVRVFETVLKEGDTYIDVGAHVGYLTLVARHYVGETGSVLAVEPQPYNCSKILINWSLNDFGNIILYPAAVSDTPGFVSLQDQPFEDRARLSLVGPSMAGDHPQRFCVPLIRLEDIVRQQIPGPITLLKLDTEGHEWEAIQGLGEEIKKVKNFIIEIWNPNLPKYKRLIAHLKNHDFVLKTMNGETWDESSELVENNLWAHRTGPF